MMNMDIGKLTTPSVIVCHFLMLLVQTIQRYNIIFSVFDVVNDPTQLHYLAVKGT